MAGAGGWQGGGGTLWAIALRTKKGKWVRGEREVSVGVTLPKLPSNWGAPRAWDAGMLRASPPGVAPHPGTGHPGVPLGTFASPEWFCRSFAGIRDFHCQAGRICHSN